ncbi:hypothetical protein FZ025_03730 [Xanthomonas hyacinthi]|nr:amidase family protein [Xanthomonas hyacinthi]QGY75816.1 hypothetical protein FZ025_03730 [Xanthomonas hyacinthi]
MRRRRGLSKASKRTDSPRKDLLHGIPIALKDLSDTTTLPTSYGSPADAGNRHVMDAACVALALALAK